MKAKEYENGNMENLFATPATAGDILAAKMAATFLLGCAALAICLLAARFLFGVPLRGSLWAVLAGSALFLCAQMALGLLVSSLAKSQFLAVQIAMVAAFMPTLLLSGFLFEIGNMPAFLRAATCLVPARWYVDLLLTEFLADDVPARLVPDLLALAAFAAVLLVLAVRANPRRVPEGGPA